MIVWLIFFGILFYWEMIYHLCCFGFVGSNPWIMLPVLSGMAALQAVITGCVPQKHKRKCFWICILPEYLVFAVQSVYYSIFRQPLQLRAMVMGGQDALTNYWKETLLGIWKASPILLALALPLFAALLLFYLKKKHLPDFSGIQKIRAVFLLGVSVLGYCMILEVGKIAEWNFYEEYTEFYDPVIVAQDMGLIPMIKRDMSFELESLVDQVTAAVDDKNSVSAWQDKVDPMVPSDENDSTSESEKTATEESITESEKTATEESIAESEMPESEERIPEMQEPEPLPAYNVINLDLEKLQELSAESKEKSWLAEYITSLEPTNTNAYTGIFEGYNLIYITAEGFSSYAIDAELTPTLYKLSNSGFVCTNYYVPLWQTSTSDGEYVNLTGLIPDGQFSMKKTKENNMAYSLPRFFNDQGCVNMAYHNNTLSYYDRHLTHPNLGYDFKASKLGELSQEEWGDHIFYMENPGRWPSSDLEMIQYTLPEYIQEERFNVYYMTVSGHMYYSFTGNSMSSKNRDAVAGLDMSENARAYIACHIELDKALEYLLTELENAGKLENTVIVLSADHYPYAMTEEQYEELAGRDLSRERELYRNSLILWNAGMEESVMITKPCCSVDILPTLLNLFGFSYDSRMFAGRDILSDAEGMVIFNDRSFVTDTVVYDRKSKETIWRKELSETEKEEYLNTRKQVVKDRYQFSAYMLRHNFYDLLKQCEVE